MENNIILLDNDTDVFDPNTSLVSRTKNWVALLYGKAEQLVWEEYKDEPPELAMWKSLTSEERKASSLDFLDHQKRDFSIVYHNLVAEKALQIADGLTEAIRASVTQIIKNQQRQMLRYQKLSGYDSVKVVAKKTLHLPSGSAGRQIEAFINTHLDDVEEAGVPEETTLTLLSRPDKFVINAARAVSRVKASELPEKEKKEKIREVVKYSAEEAEHASDIQHEYLNGHYQIERDIVTISNIQYVTFSPKTEDEFLILKKRTDDISVQFGNVTPLLYEVRSEKTRDETIRDFKIAIAVMRSVGNMPLEEAREHIEKLPRDVLEALEEMELVIQNGEDWVLTDKEKCGII